MNALTMVADVTLILGMSKADGIYMSTDFRVSDARTGELVDDGSVKFLTVHYPPEGGPRALFGYTGLAILEDGTPVGTWIRETLRGRTEVIDRSMAHLRARLDRDVANLGYPLIEQHPGKRRRTPTIRRILQRQNNGSSGMVNPAVLQLHDARTAGAVWIRERGRGENCASGPTP